VATEPIQRARHPAARTVAEKDEIVEVVRSERFCDLVPALV
jgi:hypothetical protein